ncbi:MAG: AMP-binding protein [Desulfovibrionaceae bacterium]|nr:AMP-binding protein [Desulfovibrionaceae bacterium]
MFKPEKIRPRSYEELIRDFKVTAPANFNFAFDLADALADEDPGRLAMIHVDDAGTRREYGFGYFRDASNRLANALVGRGIGRGDRVMLILYRRVEYWVSMLALAKIGALPIPSPALLTAQDIVFRANFARVRACIVEDSVAGRVQEARAECRDLEVLVQAGDRPAMDGWLDFEALVRDADEGFARAADSPGGREPMVIFFSSGTTGMPKMVLHDHSYPLGHYATAALWHDLEPGDVHLTLSDTGWAKSVWGKFYGQWMAGAVVFVWDFRGRFEPARLLDMIAGHGVTTFCAPPTVYRFLIREDLSKWDLSGLRHCTTAGELLNESVFVAWEKALGLPIYEGYGQTETCLQMATFKCMRPKPGSIGRPAPGWNIVLLDEAGRVCGPGEEGEICIDLGAGRPLGLFDGYLDEPERTARVLKADYYHTGDKAWMDEDGYFWFLGRTDDLIKSSGYRIGPFEVESALITHQAVVEAAVTAAPDPVRGQAVKATVVLAKGFSPSEELTSALQEHVKKQTAPYKYPRLIDYVEALPKTISGKIKRAEIRERDWKKAD